MVSICDCTYFLSHIFNVPCVKVPDLIYFIVETASPPYIHERASSPMNTCPHFSSISPIYCLSVSLPFTIFMLDFIVLPVNISLVIIFFTFHHIQNHSCCMSCRFHILSSPLKQFSAVLCIMPSHLFSCQLYVYKL